MEVKVNRLLFSGDGKECRIVFANGKESLYYEYIEDAMNAITDCWNQGKISSQEFGEFTAQILGAENLPYKAKTRTLAEIVYFKSKGNVMRATLQLSPARCN